MKLIAFLVVFLKLTTGNEREMCKSVVIIIGCCSICPRKKTSNAEKCANIELFLDSHN